MDFIGTIRIGGAPCSFKLLRNNGQFGVYEKAYPGGRITYLIVRLPSVRVRTEHRASAVAEFQDAERALATFERWRQDPLLTKPYRKKQAPDPVQTELALEFSAQINRKNPKSPR
jgi:hypothetical protein